MFFLLFHFSAHHLHSLFLLFLLPSLPSVPAARPAPSDTLVESSNNTPTWLNFQRFIDLEKGSQVTGVSDLKKYFHRFGYLPESVNFTDVFDSALESAVFNYQRNLGLPVTGQLDSDTIDLIMSPRCGIGDSHTRATSATTPLIYKTQHYAYFYGRPRWIKPPPVTLTYAFLPNKMIDYITKDEISAVFSRAFARWAKVIPLNFTQVDNHRTADIKIGFYRGDHGDGEPFDGVLGVLAHAFSPQNGGLHLDKAETWAVDFDEQKSKVAVDLESVATHEIGHVLGLAHSSVRESVMYPSLSPRRKKVELRIDDVEGVQALYGSNPNFRFSSLLEAEKSVSNGGNGLVFGLCWWGFWALQLHLLFGP